MSFDGFDSHKMIALKPTNKSNARPIFCLLNYKEQCPKGARKKKPHGTSSVFFLFSRGSFASFMLFFVNFFCFGKSPISRIVQTGFSLVWVAIKNEMLSNIKRVGCGARTKNEVRFNFIGLSYFQYINNFHQAVNPNPRNFSEKQIYLPFSQNGWLTVSG